MNTIDLNKQFSQLDGAPLEGNTMAKFLAEKLACSQGQASFAKMALWAQSLYKNGSLEIDDPDKEFIVSFVKADNSMASLIKHQLIEALK